MEVVNIGSEGTSKLCKVVQVPMVLTSYTVFCTLVYTCSLVKHTHDQLTENQKTKS